MANIIRITTKEGGMVMVTEDLIEKIKSLDLVPEEMSRKSISAIGILFGKLENAIDLNEKILKARQ